MDSRQKLNLNHALLTLKKPFPWFFNQAEYIKRHQALEVIKEDGDYQAIPGLFEFSLKVPGNMMLPVVRVISEILFWRTPLDQPQLVYRKFRRLRFEPWHIDDFIRFPTQEAVCLLCLASVNTDGFVREKALRYLSNFNIPELIPFVIYRLADWVPEISEIAHQILPQFLDQKYVEAYIYNYKLLYWLSADRRKDLTPAANSIMRVLTDKKAQPDLIGAMKAARPNQKRFLIKTLARSNPMEAIRTALDSSDFQVKLSIIPYVSKLDYAHSIMFLDRLLRDKSRPVRLKTLQYIPAGEYDRFENTFLELLHDPMWQIREKTRLILSVSKNWDFADLYRKAIQRQEVKPGTVLGLAETGDENDKILIKPFLESKNPLLVSAAMIGLDKFRDQHLYAHLIPFLTHSNGMVKRAAKKIIIEHIDRDKILAMRRLVQAGKTPNKKQILKILLQYGGWGSIVDILFIILYGEEELANMAWVYIPHWLQKIKKIFVEPNREDKDQARSLFFAIKIANLPVPGRISPYWDELEEVLG